MTQETEAKFYNALNQIRQIGSVRFRKLLNYFPTLEAAWRAPMTELMAAGVEPNIAETIQTQRPEIDPDTEWKKLELAGVSLITFGSPVYPRLLKEIYNPPALLYVRGNAECLNKNPAIAVVGTRKMTLYGKELTPLLVRPLAQAGVVVVSGLAWGIDEMAHRTTVEAGGKTVAVLGSGIDDESVYPSANRPLAQKIIASGGALVSELPLGSAPLKMHFPFRNRIISGLALGTVVVEADLESGSLITARQALEQNRQVFAVPGSIFNRASQGPNNLLKLGAKAVTSAADILEELNLASLAQELEAKKILPETPQEATLLKLLSSEPVHINKLIKESGLPAHEVSSAMIMMEIKGKVRNLGAQQYVIGR